ncbi:MAG: Crp/Fnr family transcriptional regulator [Bacteroidota bacterium]
MNAASDQLLSLVKTHFPQLSEVGLQEEMAQVGRLMNFEGGEIIMEYGSYVRMVPLVIRGSIKVMREGEDGGELLLYFLKEGDTCSVSFTCCMTEKRSSIRTVAEADTEIIAIPVEQVNHWMNAYRSWRNFVMLTYDQRIFELVQTVDNIAFKKMDERLLAYLQKRAEVSNSSDVALTHQEIAYDLHASRETVSRLLKKLEEQGIVRLHRSKIELL